VLVLVAEDEAVMADTIAEGLRRRAMAVDVCYDGDAALERVMVNRYDVVILRCRRCSSRSGGWAPTGYGAVAASALAWPSSGPSSARTRARCTPGRARRAG
jgi:hypothetical protein